MDEDVEIVLKIGCNLSIVYFPKFFTAS